MVFWNVHYYPIPCKDVTRSKPTLNLHLRPKKEVKSKLPIDRKEKGRHARSETGNLDGLLSFNGTV